MQLVLVAGFNTKVAKTGPRVKLFAGNWHIVMENHTDSELILHDDIQEHPISNGTKFYSPVPCTVYLSVKKHGTESFINVFAEYIRDPKSAKSA